MTSASNSCTALPHNLSLLSIRVTSCPSEIKKEARFKPTLPAPTITIYMDLLPNNDLRLITLLNRPNSDLKG
jgi:hypothetical protein